MLMRSAFPVPLLGGIFIVLWSSGFVVSKLGLEYTGTFTLLFWRYLLVTAALGVLVVTLGKWRRLPRAELVHHIKVGVLAHGIWPAAAIGAMDLEISPTLVAFVVALHPLITGTLSARMTGEAVSKREWLGLLLGFVAVGIVIGDSLSLGGSIIAHSLPFVAVVAITLAFLIDRGGTISGKSGATVLLITFWHCVVCLAFFFPLAIGIDGLEVCWEGIFVFVVVWLALAVSLIAYGLMFVLLRRLSAPRVASLMYLSPPVTMVLVWIVFGEVMTLPGFLGFALAGVAVWLTLRLPGMAGKIERS